MVLAYYSEPLLLPLRNRSAVFCLFFKQVYLFICFWLCRVFVVAQGLPLVVVGGGCGARASLLLGVWNLPGPGIEPIPWRWPVDSHPLRHQASPEMAVLLDSFPNVLTGCLCRCRNLARVSVGGAVCVPTRGLSVIPGSEYCMSASQPASQPASHTLNDSQTLVDL